MGSREGWLLLQNFGIELSSQEVPLQVLSSIYNVSPLSSRWISVVPLGTLETPKQKVLWFKYSYSNRQSTFDKDDIRFHLCFKICFKKTDVIFVSKIQVFGLLVHLSSPITRFTLNAYQTVSLTVTLFKFKRFELDENTYLEVGFPLRCFQRLSSPYIATQRLPLAR